MINIELIRQNPDQVRQDLGRKGEDPLVVDTLIELDKKRRESNQILDNLREQRNTTTKDIAKLIRQGENATGAKESTRLLGDSIKDAEESLRKYNDELKQLLLKIPNPPSQEVPDGEGEQDNVVVRVENFKTICTHRVGCYF